MKLWEPWADICWSLPLTDFNGFKLSYLTDLTAYLAPFLASSFRHIGNRAISQSQATQTILYVIIPAAGAVLRPERTENICKEEERGSENLRLFAVEVMSIDLKVFGCTMEEIMIFIGRTGEVALKVSSKLNVGQELFMPFSTRETLQLGCCLLHDQRLNFSLGKRQTECQQSKVLGSTVITYYM